MLNAKVTKIKLLTTLLSLTVAFAFVFNFLKSQSFQEYQVTFSGTSLTTNHNQTKPYSPLLPIPEQSKEEKEQEKEDSQKQNKEGLANTITYSFFNQSKYAIVRHIAVVCRKKHSKPPLFILFHSWKFFD